MSIIYFGNKINKTNSINYTTFVYIEDNIDLVDKVLNYNFNEEDIIHIYWGNLKTHNKLNSTKIFKKYFYNEFDVIQDLNLYIQIINYKLCDFKLFQFVPKTYLATKWNSAKINIIEN